MKRFLHVLRPIVAAVCVFGVWGCDDSEDPVPNNEEKTTFEIIDKTVKVAAEGGPASASYRVTNPVEGVTAQAETEAAWITGFEAKSDALAFQVTANTDETEREAVVRVTYADLTGSFTVKQAAKNGEEPDNKAFEITVVNLEATSVEVSVIPEDKEMTYVWGSISTADLNTFPDDLTFVTEWLIPLHEKAAKEAGMTVEELMDQALLKGDSPSLKAVGFAANTEYCVFCIGMDNKLEVLSDFEKVVFTTPQLPAFDATITVEVEGATASCVFSPADSEIGYYRTVYEGTGYDQDVLLRSAQSTVESDIMALSVWGIPREAAVASITLRGEKIDTYALTAETDYTVIMFAINELGYVSSLPVVEEFSTGKPSLSQNVITVEYDKVGGRKAEFTVKTSVPEDPYVFFAFQYADSFKTMSDEEIIAWICDLHKKDMWKWVRHGDVATYEEYLRTETEYVVYAFGYDGGVITTPLFESTFTTTEATLNGCTFRYNYGPYYNGDEAGVKYPSLAEKAAGKVVLPADYEVTGKWYGIWHAVYAGDLTDKTQYPDEDVYQALLKGNVWFQSHMLYTLKYDEEYTMCGFVSTEDGNYSEIWREKIGPFTPEGCSPIDEFNEPDLEPKTASLSATAPRMFDFDALVSPLLNSGGKPQAEAAAEVSQTPSPEVRKAEKVQRPREFKGILLHTCDQSVMNR